MTSNREAIARAIYTRSGPQPRRWENLPASVLEYWGSLADAAIAASACAPPPEPVHSEGSLLALADEIHRARCSNYAGCEPDQIELDAARAVIGSRWLAVHLREAVGGERLLASVRNQDIRDLVEELIGGVTDPADQRHEAIPVEQLRAILDKHQAATRRG